MKQTNEADMYRENYLIALKNEIIEMVAGKLTPAARLYGYSETPLESAIKWKPQVLVLGNYSSGKSTLINEFLGATIQKTGQAPTDDSFTILTYDDSVSEESGIRVTDERDGKFLMNDPEYPFEYMKRHGQRFASHFCLKKINSPFLKNLALIDTPGMIDSITERDRGYNYQEVIGDLARTADLILVLFDPHKAGTGREAHESLRDTLPKETFEDRLLFVLNRIDECASLADLLRVYGTLCWNLSQMTGRKDIPMIHLTYSQHASQKMQAQHDSEYLHLLENQREELKTAIQDAPRYQLDNIATFVEVTSERLSHLLGALIIYKKRLRNFKAKFTMLGILLSLIAGAATSGIIFFAGFPVLEIFASAGAATAVGVFLIWVAMAQKTLESRFEKEQLEKIDNLTNLKTQARRDTWNSVKGLVKDYILRTGGKYSMSPLELHYRAVRSVVEKGSKEIRAALNEYANLKSDDIPDDDTID